MNDVIEQFVEQFYDENEVKSALGCYMEMKKASEKILIDELEKIGCKAIVTLRIKNRESLRRKLYKRNKNSEKYKTFNDIWNDIFDFLSLRVSLYFPNDMELVDKIIRNNFLGEFSEKNFRKTL